jgi:UDP-2,4-diacetamido-2,4,6-trideoxy-beta-L-altropyranose hydrolase
VKNPPLLLIRADASTAIGSGHVTRCLALANAWQDAGGRVCYLMAENIPALDQWLARENVEQARFSVEPGSKEDAEQTAAWAHRLDVSWVVVDGYRFRPDYVRTLKASGMRVLFLDDDARFDSYAADVVLNQNIEANEGMYGKRAPGTRLLLGADYVLLRPEFLREPRTRVIAGVGRKLLVTMGGSDPENVTLKVLQALSGMAGTDFAATIVVGGGNPHHVSLQAVAESLPGKICLERNPANMARLMSMADVAISAAGGTCWELAFLGVPMIVIVLTSDQEANASAISQQGAALSLGRHATLSPRQISDALRDVLNDVERRRAMSERGQRLVDGQGAARVVEFIKNSL